jgi:hypothetical protein
VSVDDTNWPDLGWLTVLPTANDMGDVAASATVRVVGVVRPASYLARALPTMFIHSTEVTRDDETCKHL